MAAQRRYAVLIGVDVYEDTHALPTLKYCAADCKLLQQALGRAGGFPAEHVLPITGESGRSDHLPRRSNIIAQLRAWAQRPEEDDLFLVVFCGHAREVDGSVYLLPGDARVAELELTGLPVSFIMATLKGCPARSKLLFLDACHSGSGRDSTVMSEAFAGQLRAEGVTVLSACKVNEVAHECDDLKHGVFSYFLARGLEGAALGPSGAVTADGLYRFVHREVVGWAAKRAVAQTPWRLSEGTGDPVLIGRPPSRRGPSGPDGSLSMPRFHYGSVVPPECFIGREAELREGLEKVEAGQSFLLVGDRRAGKTSFCKMLIRQLMSRPDNRTLASYFNLQRCLRLRIDTFLQETLNDMMGEIARQLFHLGFMDLLDRDPAGANPVLREDELFQRFLRSFKLARKAVGERKAGRRGSLGTREFECFVLEHLLPIIQAKGWETFAIFYDEANRLPGAFPVEVLASNVEALSLAGVVHVYAASPEMAESFAPLEEQFYDQIAIGPFSDPADMRRLLARYCHGDAASAADLPLRPDALELLWELTGGRPYLIQLVAGQSFRCARQQRAQVITADHVRDAHQFIRLRRPEVRFGGGAYPPPA